MSGVFCIDSSSIFDAWSRHYPPDVFPSLWTKLEALIAQGSLVSPEEVRDELRDPDLAAWAKSQDDLFRELDDDAYQAAVTEVVDRVRAELGARRLKLRPQDFKADPFVVALARHVGAAVVCEEAPQNAPGARPKIPNLCAWYGIRCITLAQLIRGQGWVF